MTTSPLEEKNWEEWQQIQLYKAQLCCGDGSQIRNSFFNGKRGKQQRGSQTQKWLGLFMLEDVELNTHLNMGLFWFYRLQCLALPWWAMKTGSECISAPPDSEKSWWMWGTREWCRSEQCLLLFAMDLKENIS